MGTRIDKVTKKDRARQTERGGEDECDVENSGVEERAKEGLVNRTSMLVYSLLCCLFVSIGTGAFVGVSLSNTEAKPTTIAAIGTQPEGTPPSTSNSSPSPTIASPASSPAGNNVTVSPVGSPTSPPTANSLLSPTTQAPTSNVRNFKKGLALHEMQGCNGLEAHTNSSWWYSWGTEDGFSNGFCESSEQAAAQARRKGIEFVPMFWNHVPVIEPGSETEHNLKEANYLMTFNEPEKKGQANLSPSEAAELWPEIEEIANAYNLSLVAPCVTQDAGRRWYREWQVACDERGGGEGGCSFDYTCIHLYYQPFPCGANVESQFCIQDEAQRATNRIDQYYNEWKKPIWVTEYACAPWGSGGGCSKADHEAIMNQLTPYLERKPEVFRYAWFSTYGVGSSTGWVGNALNDPIWDEAKGVGCSDRKWIGGIGNTWDWQIQTVQECWEASQKDDDCFAPYSLSIDDDACYCATDACSRTEPTWPAMFTWWQMEDPDTSTLTALGELYNRGDFVADTILL